MRPHDPTKCKELIWTGDTWHRHKHQCPRKASTEAGYCKQHDPECRKVREAKAPLTKWERQRDARRRVEEIIDILMVRSPDDALLVELRQSHRTEFWG